MDIKEQYFNLAKQGITNVYNSQHQNIEYAADLLGKTMENGGVIQLFGVNHGEEVVNELFFRAGGLSPFHGLKPMDLAFNGLIKRDIIDDGSIYTTDKYVDDLLSLYKLDDRDGYVITSFYGNEAMAVELAKRAKEKGQVVVAIVNKASYDISKPQHTSGKKLLDYANCYVDMCASKDDIALHVDKYAIGQLSSVYGNVIAQMLTAQIYNWYINNNIEPPVLLSANLAGADKHNNALTDKYQGRVR